MTNMTAKRAFITGGTGGVGACAAWGLARKGLHVVIADLDQQKCDELAAEINAEGHSAQGVALDVTNRADVEAVLAKEAEQGGVDVLVTSAAIVKPAGILDFPVEDWNNIINVNLNGTFHVCQVAGKQMVEKGFGRIITMSSVNGQIANSFRGAYSCTKGAVDMLTKLLAAELGKHGITANAIAPTPIDTPMIRQVHGPKDREVWHNQLPIKRYAQPEEVASAVCYLASDDAAYINGHILNMDGGFMASGILLD